MFAELVPNRKYYASALPDGYQKPFLPLVIMNDDYSIVDDNIELKIYSSAGDVNIILDFESAFVGPEFSGTSIDATVTVEMITNAQPLIHIDTNLETSFTLYVEVTYKGEVKVLRQPVQTLTKENIRKRIGNIEPYPYYHLAYAYGAGGEQRLTYTGAGDGWGEGAKIIINVDNDAVLKDNVGNIVSDITLDANDEMYEYIFSCQAINKGIPILSVSLGGTVPAAEQGLIYQIPYILMGR